MNDEDNDERLGWFHALVAGAGMVALGAIAYAGVSLLVAVTNWLLGITIP